MSPLEFKGRARGGYDAQGFDIYRERVGAFLAPPKLHSKKALPIAVEQTNKMWSLCTLY